MQCWSLYNVQHTMEGEEEKERKREIEEGMRKEAGNEYKKENI